MLECWNAAIQTDIVPLRPAFRQFRPARQPDSPYSATWITAAAGVILGTQGAVAFLTGAHSPPTRLGHLTAVVLLELFMCQMRRADG
ncbi:hypothetical protein AS189_02015 [Arthrobacter alpinus]|uniref:Uncharacterized protein n=1 Tax=Arthrobacter alpinus TaxID=656366 RepID=A0A0S2LVL6_9MICC|nr:hypothetical protein [Arthrobacter alpinus]ALO65491.1 hypothetical protein AS189_02015 [Arthrobacter alpinus]